MIWIGCIDLHKSIYSFEVRKTGRIMKKVIFFLVLSFVVMHSHFAQNNSLSFTQQYLMSHKWYPDIYDEDDLDTSFITYTMTQEIDSVFTEEGEIELYISDYYLSETKDMIFDTNKIGKNVSGKYLVTASGTSTDGKLAYVMEIVLMSDEKMVLKHLTEGFTSTGKTTTYYTSPLR